MSTNSSKVSKGGRRSATHCHMLLCVTALLVCIDGLVVNADSVRIKDGSMINGTIVSMDDQKLCIDTLFAGRIEVNVTTIAEVAANTKVHVHLKSGSTLFGTVAESAEGSIIQTEDGKMTVAFDRIAALWQDGAANPLAPQTAVPAGRKWNYAVAVDVRGKTGNTESFSGAATVKATLKGKGDRLNIYGRAHRARENSNNTAKEMIGGIDLESDIKDRHSWYARNELEKDEFEFLDLRATAALGYGYYFRKIDEQQLRGRIGLAYRHESWMDGTSNSHPGLDVGLHHVRIFKSWAKMVNDITYTPSFSEWTNYVLTHASTLDISLAESDLWKLRLGIRHDYTSMPVGADIKHLDTTYFAGLALTW